MIQDIMDLPGQVPESLAILPLSHIALLDWVLGEDTAYARAVDNVYKMGTKELQEFKKNLAERRKALFPAEPLDC